MDFRLQWWCIVSLTQMIKDDYNGEWEHGQMRILALSFWGICWKCKEGHPDKKETSKGTERRERGQWWSGKTWKTVFIQYRGHGLLWLPGKHPFDETKRIDPGDLDNRLKLIFSWPDMNKNSQKVPYREQVSAAKVITVYLDNGKIFSETVCIFI